MSRVFLIMRAETAALVQSVIQARIDTLNETECTRAEVRAEMDAERARLQTVVGQLEEPA